MIIKHLQLFILLFLPSFLTLESLSGKDLSTNKPISNTTCTPSNTIITNLNNIIDAPIYYSAKDSMTLTLDSGSIIHMFGESSLQYRNLNLSSEYIEINADSNTIFATFVLDSTRKEIFPILKEKETQYEMKKARYNFKTKKMFINDAIIQQGEGYITASIAKKISNNDFYIKNGRYTTCDNEHPHFYFQLTKAKIQPKKRIIAGPIYLVVEDTPLPIAIPFCFFSIKSDYASGIIIPSYSNEMTRGFSFQNGGYYFALNNYIDLSLTGEIFSKGSWGLNAHSTYRKRYKASGNFQANYRFTIIGEKGENNYYKSKDMRLIWIHRQDTKANPFSTLSANVDFSTSYYNKNDLNTLYSNQYTQNFKSSSINYGYKIPNSPFYFNINTSINQILQTATLSLDLPSLVITMQDICPFRKKEQISNNSKWYEKTCISYTGLLSNNIQSIKENEVFKKKAIKDWKNGMKHDIPIKTSFNLFKYITIIPSINYTERWYFSFINQEYDLKNQKFIPVDTIYGFYRIYNYSANVSVNTKLYGLFKPWNFLGKWTKQTQIRHILTSSFNLNEAPDFSNIKYGFYKKIHISPDHDTIYSPFLYNLWGVPERGKSGTMNFTLNNNLEMKFPIVGMDSICKISLIDNLKLGISYNYLADSMSWSNLVTSIRFKLGQYVLGLQGTFDTYIYNEQGARINIPRWKIGKGIGRLKSTSTSFTYSLNNEIVKKWFTKNDKKITNNELDTNNETFIVSNETDSLQHFFLRKAKKNDINYDKDGYLLVNILWSLKFNYSLSLDYNLNEFNNFTREYAYQSNQALNILGSVNLTKNWSINFNTNYDFECKKFVTMSYFISRKMHCWIMSAKIIPIGPYQSYYFTIAANSFLLKNLKYTQSGNFENI